MILSRRKCEASNNEERKEEKSTETPMVKQFRLNQSKREILALHPVSNKLHLHSYEEKNYFHVEYIFNPAKASILFSRNVQRLGDERPVFVVASIVIGSAH